MSVLVIRNRQKARPVDTRFLRKITIAFLKEHPSIGDYELAVHLVDDDEMTTLNETFLNHTGPTDVITFDHSEGSTADALHGELFVCVPEAMRNARPFHSTWQGELARYVVHGCLHLLGRDDKAPAPRRRMKAEESRWMRILASRFALSKLQRRRTVRS